MKKLFLSVAMLVSVLMIVSSCGNDKQKTYVKKTPTVNITSAVNPEDGLDFKLVGALFQEKTVKDAQTLEVELNRKGGINNMDMDADGSVDYLNVSENESDVKTTKSFDITSGDVDDATYVGTVEVEQTEDGYNIHMSGSEEIYGENRSYSSQHRGMSAGQMMFFAWAFHPRPLFFHSPYHHGFYPSYYGGHRGIVSRGAYNQRTSTQRTTTSKTVTKNKTPRKSSVKSKNKGKVGKKARTSINNNKKSQKSFKKRDKNKAVKKGGFTKNKSTKPKAKAKSSSRRPKAKAKSSSRSSARKSAPRKSRSSSRSSGRRRCDVNAKENFDFSTYGLNEVLAVKTYTYDYKADFVKNENLSAERQVGVVAQEIEMLIPEAVITDSITGLKEVDYAMLVTVLYAGMQQQQTLIKNLQSDLVNLQSELEVIAIK